jgi:primosomal protein N' (replication factor Y)
MSYFDIIFPLNIGPLTYKCPENLIEKAQPGMIVSAPLKNKMTKGIIINKKKSLPVGRIKDFHKIHGNSPALSLNTLKLLQWMSDYYIVSEGLVLKQTVPKEIFVRTRAKKTKKVFHHEMQIEPINIQEKDVSPVIKSSIENKYQAFLFHSPSLMYEYSLVLQLLSSLKNVIVLLPEVTQANLLFNVVKKIFKERTCLLHGEMTRGKRSEYIEGIIDKKHDIVIGTRSALFTPMKYISLIIILNEHSSSFKLEEGIRFNLRDVAVMRGFIEKATVLLSSITPTIDSYFNALTNKYQLIKSEYKPKRPRINIVDMRFSKNVRPNFSKAVFDATKNRLKENKKILFLINRRGYSTLFQCRDCGYSETCTLCNIPMVLHKQDKSLKCHYCGTKHDIPERCNRCKSFNVELLGAGTQRIQETIKEKFGIESLRFDSDKAKKKTDIEELMKNISNDSTKIVIGTKMLTKRMWITEKFSMASVFNIDNFLNLPDFRASEKAYMEISSVADHIEPDGELIIQTRFPHNPLFKYLRANEYESFVKEEISIRKKLNYPPYTKLINIKFTGNFDLADEIIRRINDLNENIEVLGPLLTKSRKSGDELSILLKSVDRKTLNTSVRTILSKYGKTKDINIRIDVDPL